MVFPAFWRRGVGGAAVAMMVELLRVEWGVTRLVASVDLRNVSSRALLVALGFEQIETRASSIRGEATSDAIYEMRGVGDG